jgi:hypothetical protein
VLLQQLLFFLHDEPQLPLKVGDALRNDSTRSLQARQLSRCGLQGTAAAAAAAAQGSSSSIRSREQAYEELFWVGPLLLQLISDMCYSVNNIAGECKNRCAQ